MKILLAQLAAAAVALTAAHAAFACEPPAPPRPGVHVDDRWDRRNDGRGDRVDHDGWRWRHHAWRDQERARLRAEYARLDDARADFYARPHRGWRNHRFETWYAGARAELDLRWNRLRWAAR
jgi:hypothetical protein